VGHKNDLEDKQRLENIFTPVIPNLFRNLSIKQILKRVQDDMQVGQWSENIFIPLSEAKNLIIERDSSGYHPQNDVEVSTQMKRELIPAPCGRGRKGEGGKAFQDRSKIPNQVQDDMQGRARVGISIYPHPQNDEQPHVIPNLIRNLFAFKMLNQVQHDRNKNSGLVAAFTPQHDRHEKSGLVTGCEYNNCR